MPRCQCNQALDKKGMFPGVNCPNCKTHNPSNANYCSQCGDAMAAPEDDVRGREDQGLGQQESPYGPFAPTPVVQPAVLFYPRSVGQLVAETLTVYGANFGLLWRIALVAYLPEAAAFIAGSFIPNDALEASLTLAGLFTGLLAGAAVTYAVSQYYLDRRVRVSVCYVAALNYALSLLGAFLLYAAAIVVGAFTIIGIPLLLYVVVAWFFNVQAIIIERKGPIAALERSRGLVRGSWWRVSGIGIVFIALVISAAFTVSIPGLILRMANDTLGGLLVTTGGVFVAPIAWIGATLVYFDLRVRKEGYNVETLASEMG